MAVPQQKFREIVFQALYSIDLGQSEDEAIAALLMQELSVTKKTLREALERVHAIRANQSKLDEQIAETSLSYSFKRIQTVEKNILRLGLYELLHDQEIPPKVAIAEAIRLARKFGTPESALFINALLDAIYQQSTGTPLDPTQLNEAIETLVESETIANEAALEEEAE